MRLEVGRVGYLKSGRIVARGLLVLFLLAAALAGCSGGGFLPQGPHAISQAHLTTIIARQAHAARVPARLVAAVVRAESGGDPSAISRTGAQGLMQLMPGTAAMLGVGDPWDPEENVAGGARYLHYLLGHYKGNVKLALAAYNAGPGAVDAFHGVPPFPETRAYVAEILATLRTN